MSDSAPPANSGAALEVDFLHETGSPPAAAEPLEGVLASVVEFLYEVIGPDSVFVYVLEGGELALRASEKCWVGATRA